MEINWNKYFDKIFIYSCADQFERREHLNNELQRIGCNNYEYFITCKTDELIDKSHFKEGIKIKPMQITHGEYLLIKTAYELGYNNILLLEDDISFLKDNNKIFKLLEEFYNIKNDVNIYLFDFLKYESVYFLSSCVYLDRLGMEYMIYCIENYNLVVDMYFPMDFNNNIISFFGDTYRTDIKLPNQFVSKLQISNSEYQICIQHSTDYDIENVLIVPDRNLYNE